METNQCSLNYYYYVLGDLKSRSDNEVYKMYGINLLRLSDGHVTIKVHTKGTSEYFYIVVLIVH